MTDQTRRRRALVVDDDAMMIKLVGELLQRAMDVQFAKTGEESAAGR